MNKSFQIFGRHVWIIILLFVIAYIGLIAAGFLSPFMDMEHVGVFIYSVGGLALFYMMFNRYSKNRKDQVGNQDGSEDTFSTLVGDINMNDSAGNRVRETIKKRKAYYKDIARRNRS